MCPAPRCVEPLALWLVDFRPHHRRVAWVWLLDEERLRYVRVLTTA